MQINEVLFSKLTNILQVILIFHSRSDLQGKNALDPQPPLLLLVPHQIRIIIYRGVQRERQQKKKKKFFETAKGKREEIPLKILPLPGTWRWGKEVWRNRFVILLIARQFIATQPDL